MLNYPQSGASGGAGGGGGERRESHRACASTGPQRKASRRVGLRAEPADVHQGAVAGGPSLSLSARRGGWLGGWVASRAPPCGEGDPLAFPHLPSGVQSTGPCTLQLCPSALQAPSLAAFNRLELNWAAIWDDRKRSNCGALDFSS